MHNLTKSEAKHVEAIRQSGWISVSRIDSMIWRKRQTLDSLTDKGVLVKYKVSPSYDGYRLA